MPKVGDRGAFRKWGSTDPLQYVTVGTCQDDGFLGVTLDGFASRYVHFSPTTGAEDGYRDEPTATGEERVTFDGDHIMISRSGDIHNGPMGIFEWFNRVPA